MNTDIKWGVLSNNVEIRNALAKLDGSPGADITFEHLTSGFTDNVFLATVGTTNHSNKYIVKQYLKIWHSKEGNFYQEVLSKHSSLGAPKLLYTGGNFIILEFVQGKSMSKYDINLLKEWIVNKHMVFINANNLQNYVEPLDTKIHYLVDKPVTSLKLLAKTELVDDLRRNLIIQTTELSDYYISLIKGDLVRPQTLEHGDLEPQNVFVTVDNYLRVIDWVNARHGSGLFDINQFFETADELGFEYDKNILIKEFSAKLNIANLSVSLDEVRILMLLNKTNYYIGKLLNSELKSPAKNKPVTSLIFRYLDELFSLLIKAGKIPQV